MLVTSNFGTNPWFLRSLRINRNADRLSGNSGPACRGPRLRGRRHARGTSACRRSEQPSRPGASIARAGTALPQLARDQGAKFQHPAPHRFIGDVKPTLGQQFLDVPVAQGQAEIQPDRVLDDLGRKAMTAVGEPGHLDILPGTALSRLRFRDSASGRALPGGCAGRGRACRRQSPRPVAHRRGRSAPAGGREMAVRSTRQRIGIHGYSIQNSASNSTFEEARQRGLPACGFSARVNRRRLHLRAKGRDDRRERGERKTHAFT